MTDTAKELIREATVNEIGQICQNTQGSMDTAKELITEAN